MAPIFEGAQAVDRGDKGGGGQRPHASDGSEPLTHRGVRGELRDARIVSCEFGILRYRPVDTHPRGAPDRGRSVHCPHLPQSTGSPSVCGQYLEARQELFACHLLVQRDVPLGVNTMEWNTCLVVSIPSVLICRIVDPPANGVMIPATLIMTDTRPDV